MSYTDLFTPNESLQNVSNKIPTFGGPPVASYGYTLGTAFQTPSVMGSGLYAKLADAFESSRTLGASELQALYPDAPPDLFEERMTARQAEFIYNRASKLSALNAAKQTRGTGFLGTLGYGIVEELTPLSVGIGAVGGVVGAGVLGAGYVGSSILASTLIGGTVEAVAEYAIRKGLEDYTKERASITEAVVGGAIGGALGETLSIGARQGARAIFDDLGRVGGRNPFKYFNQMMDRAPKETKENIGRMLQEEVQRRASESINNIGAQSTVLRTVNDLPMWDRIRYKTYSSATPNPDFERSGLYALFVKESPASYNGPEQSFAGGLYLSDNPSIIKGYASSVRQGGEIVKIDVNSVKVFDGTLPIDKAQSKMFKELFETFKITVGEKESLSDIVARVNDDSFEQSIRVSLTEAGFDGISLRDTGKILDLEYNNKSTFLFKDIQELPRNIVDMVDGSIGAIPLESSAGTPITSKAYNLKYSTGILSNGKKIELDPEGYFATDPLFGGDDKAIGYYTLWDVGALEQINDAVKKGDVRYVKKKYQDLNDETLDYLKQMRDYMLFENASARSAELDAETKYIANFVRNNTDKQITAKLKELGVAPKDMESTIQILKSAAELEDRLAEIKAVEDLLVARGEKEAMGGKGKSVDELTKEVQAEKILEQNNFENVTKEMVDSVTKRIGTPKEVQNPQIIKRWEDFANFLKENNPELASQIVKAADACLRKNT
jgi:hypothetical protein